MSDQRQTNCRLKITSNAMFLTFLNSHEIRIFLITAPSPISTIIHWKKKICWREYGDTHGIFRDLPWVFLSFFIIHSVPREGTFFLFFHKVPLVLELPNNKKGKRLKLGWNRCLNVIFFHWRVLKDGGIEGRSLWKLALRGFPPLYVKDGFVR